MSRKEKKEVRIIVTLFLFMIIAVLGYIAVLNYSNKKKERETSVETITLMTVDSESAVEVKLENENGTLEFVKKDEMWKKADDEKFVVNETEINNIISALSTVTANKLILDRNDSLGEYGLDNPAATATLTLENGTCVVLELGSAIPIEGGYYGMLDDGDAVYSFDESTYLSLFDGEENLKAEEVEATEEVKATEE
ncbi:DUF4340 domain-containing protein [Anaeromicropila populeti]|uniref:DUF4340 domain-containing protein n=1 Tax=Anaeromicropila populeti TaxID=37658 RepID=A0A1I6HS46_9FIRM|nr:DUF4340 domain-containing protein [Anaeromicropila populeti]SFR57090.1 protein of unknown function [Anaeromicropila populeti]